MLFDLVYMLAQLKAFLYTFEFSCSSTYKLPVAYLGFSKGGRAKPGGLGDFRPPAGSGAEPKWPGYFSKGGIWPKWPNGKYATALNVVID